MPKCDEAESGGSDRGILKGSFHHEKFASKVLNSASYANLQRRGTRYFAPTAWTLTYMGRTSRQRAAPTCVAEPLRGIKTSQDYEL